MSGGFVGDDPVGQLRPYLRPGEQLVWAGRPDPAVRFTAADAFLIPFSILFCGFSLFWESAVLTGGGPPFFVLWGLPFIAMGSYVTVGRFIYKARRKRRTAYGLTDQRALVVVGTSAVQDGPVKGIGTSVTRTRDGRHVTVTFASPWPAGRGFPFGFGMGNNPALVANTGMEFFARTAVPVGFFDVDDPDRLLVALAQVQGG